MGNKPSMIKATAIGGLAAAFLSSIPIVACLNVFCCSLLIGGGFFAAFLYSRDVQAVGGSFTVGNGAVVGLVSAVFYAVGGVVMSLVTSLIFGSSFTDSFEQMREQIEAQGNLPPEALESLDQLSTFFAESGGAVLAIIGIGISLLLGAVFCTIGGVIGGAVFKKTAAASAPPAEPPVGV